MIQEGIPQLLSRLGNLKREGVLTGTSGIVLLKKLVFETLHVQLSENGYNILNHKKIDFPKYYCDRDTIKGIKTVLGIG